MMETTTRGQSVVVGLQESVVVVVFQEFPLGVHGDHPGVPPAPGAPADMASEWAPTDPATDMASEWAPTDLATEAATSHTSHSQCMKSLLEASNRCVS